MGHRLHAGSQLFLLCGLLNTCVFDIKATVLPQRNRLRRERLLRPEFGNSLSLLRSTFLPQGEVANRISGNEWKRAFGGITGRPVNPFLPDRRDTILTSKTVAAVGAGLAAVAGLTIDNNRNTKPVQHPNSQQARRPQSQCSKTAEQLFSTLDHALNTSVRPSQQGKRDTQSWNASSSRSSGSSSNVSSGSGFLAQSGYIDFGLTDSQDTQAPCHPNCAFSNPSVAYGLTVLPLNPRENITAKITNDKTPGYVKDNLDGRYGDRMAPVWQLQQDEVLVLAGCTPPGEASRYFGVTGYIYSTYTADSDQWINVFASLGDTASITTISDAAVAAAAGSAHNKQQQQQQQQQLHSDKGSAAPGFQISSGRLKTGPPVDNSSSSDRRGSSFNSNKCSSSSSSFGALTVILMGANPTTVDAAAATIRNSIAAAAASTRNSTSKVPDLQPVCPDYINIVPIPGPDFSDAIGLSPTSSYYTLVARNMAPSGDEGATAFQAYMEHPHLKAWRLTPVAGSSSSSNSGGGSKGKTADRDGIGASTGNGSSSSYDATGSSNKGQQRSAMPNVTAAAGTIAATDDDDYADSNAAPAAAVRSENESVGDFKSNRSSNSTGRSSSNNSSSSNSTGSNSYGLPYVIPRHSYDAAGASFIINSTSGSSSGSSSSSGSDRAATEVSAASAATRADGLWRATTADHDTAAVPTSSSNSNITSRNSSGVNGSSTGLTACTSAQPSSMSRGPPCSIHHKLAAAVAMGVSRAINQLLVAQPAVAESLRNEVITASQNAPGTYTADTAGDDNSQSGDQPAINSSTPQGSRQHTNSSSTASDRDKNSSSHSNSSSSSSGSNTTHNQSRIATSEPRSAVTAAVISSDQRSATTATSGHQKNATATWRQQQQQRIGPTLLQQQQMLDQLLTAVDIHYNSSYAIAFGMGSAGSLALLGVDWGLDCVEQTLDWCNGDNRDATYLSSLPLFTLNRPGQLLVVVGVNYVTAGVGSYMNIALTDPIQQLGLEAFDDVELAAAAVPWPAAAPTAAAGVNGSSDPGVQAHNVAAGLSQQVLQKLMYVVAFSRNCTGVDLPCKELNPANHPRNIPISRPLMTISRVYVNPATGVGPDPHDLIPFVTLLLTPKAVAVPGDYVARTNMSVWQTFGEREGHDQERSSMPTVAALQRHNSSRSSNISSSSNSNSNSTSISTSSNSNSASAGSIQSSGWLKRRPRLARWLEPNNLLTTDRLQQQRSGSSLARATRRWTNSSGDFDPVAAAAATRCPDRDLGTLDKQITTNPTDNTDNSSSRWSNAVLAFDQQLMAFNRTALRLIAESAHSVDSNSTEVVTAAQAAIDPCVRSLVGMSQCGGRGSPDVCCRFVQAWNNHDCWCEASGQVLLSTMPAVLTPTLLQLLSWVCEAQ